MIYVRECFACVPSGNLMVSCLMFKSLSHFEFIFFFFFFFFFSFCEFFCCFFFCHACGMWKFMGQKLNLLHSSDLSSCSDIVGFFTLLCHKGTVLSLFLLHCVRVCSHFIDLHAPTFPALLFKEAVFFLFYILASFVED